MKWLCYEFLTKKFFSKSWASKLGMRLICECGFYAGVYGINIQSVFKSPYYKYVHNEEIFLYSWWPPFIRVRIKRTFVQQFLTNVPPNTDFNFERLFSNQSATNLRDFPGNRQSSPRGPSWEVTCFINIITRTTNSYFRFTPPPTPGTRPLQTISHPRARRAGLVPGVARGGGW